MRPNLATPPARSQSAPQSRALRRLIPPACRALESITAETDIRAFFAAGVPAELTRAALRRVWTSDPKIRDFVGLADYDWDFNAPGSMAGFGPLEGADALRAQMARRLGPVSAEDDAARDVRSGPGAKQEAPASASVHDRPNQSAQIMTEDEPSQQIGASQAREEVTAQSPNMPRRSSNRRNLRTFNQLLAAGMDGPCPKHDVTGRS